MQGSYPGLSASEPLLCKPQESLVHCQGLEKSSLWVLALPLKFNAWARGSQAQVSLEQFTLFPFPSCLPGHHGVTNTTLLWKMGPCLLLGSESWKWKPIMPLTSIETCELLITFVLSRSNDSDK